MPCQTISVTSNDASSVEVSDVELSSTSPGVVIVTYTTSNVVESGNGETINPEVDITVNGEVVHTEPFTIPPGESQNKSLRIDDAPTGTVEVCVQP